jgi:hypothetical protein
MSVVVAALMRVHRCGRRGARATGSGAAAAKDAKQRAKNAATASAATAVCTAASGTVRRARLGGGPRCEPCIRTAWLGGWWSAIVIGLCTKRVAVGKL